MHQNLLTMEEGVKKYATHFLILMRIKNNGEAAAGHFGISTENKRDQLVELAERDRLRITNTFFRKRSYKRWTWKNHTEETKDEIDFILT